MSLKWSNRCVTSKLSGKRIAFVGITRQRSQSQRDSLLNMLDWTDEWLHLTFDVLLSNCNCTDGWLLAAGWRHPSVIHKYEPQLFQLNELALKQVVEFIHIGDLLLFNYNVNFWSSWKIVLHWEWFAVMEFIMMKTLGGQIHTVQLCTVLFRWIKWLNSSCFRINGTAQVRMNFINEMGALRTIAINSMCAFE